MGEVREPIKKNSIEKKKRIIEKGFELMCNKGYHNVSCVDIAEYSNVSTGIIYQYFKDKHDIFLEGVKDYSKKIMFPINDLIINNFNEEKVISDIIDSFIKKHTISKNAHSELMAMSCLDDEIASIFKDNEMLVTKSISSSLKKQGLNIDNLDEKIHIIYGIIDNYCHEVVYHKHKDLDYSFMKNEIIETIIFLLRK